MNPTVETSSATRPVPPHADRLLSAVTKAQGLLYALASMAARPPDNLIVSEPTKEEAEGLVWLAMDLGHELGLASNEYIAGHPAIKGPVA